MSKKHEYKTGWIGVDFDGTLAEYHGWNGALSFGPPIPRMVERVKRWIADGETVKIVTARSAPQNDIPIGFTFEQVRCAISDWCFAHIGIRLEVTHSKDYAMTELWDDRAVQLESNTGIELVEQLRARAEAAEKERDVLEHKYEYLLHTYNRMMSRSAKDYDAIRDIKNDKAVLENNNSRLRKEIEELKTENERLKAENLAMCEMLEPKTVEEPDGDDPEPFI